MLANPEDETVREFCSHTFELKIIRAARNLLGKKSHLKIISPLSLVTPCCEDVVGTSLLSELAGGIGLSSNLAL